MRYQIVGGGCGAGHVLDGGGLGRDGGRWAERLRRGRGRLLLAAPLSLVLVLALGRRPAGGTTAGASATGGGGAARPLGVAVGDGATCVVEGTLRLKCLCCTPLLLLMEHFGVLLLLVFARRLFFFLALVLPFLCLR